LLGGKKELSLMSCGDLEETSLEDGYSRLLENVRLVYYLRFHIQEDCNLGA
jgi:hypothetical protein